MLINDKNTSFIHNGERQIYIYIYLNFHFAHFYLEIKSFLLVQIFILQAAKVHQRANTYSLNFLYVSNIS